MICPECNSTGPFYKDGKRQLSNGSSVQRYLCRKCGFRFSENAFNLSRTNTKRQICALKQQVKNLEPQAKTRLAGDIKKLPQETRGLIAKYMAYLERQGYYKDTCYLRLIEKLAKDGANLLDPEDVKEKIAKHKKKNGEPWKDSVKKLASHAYDAFCKMEGIEWTRPHYRQRDSEIYVPNETDLDQLIASTYSKRMATFLQTLKETFADPGEILRLEWRDIKDNVISIRYPVKGHLAGSKEVSAKLISMLNNLPKKSKRVFPTNYRSMETSFLQIRKRLAAKLQNPKLLNVSFKSFRHFGGTMMAEYTNGNVLTVKKMLRHKSVLSTMKYIHAVHFKEDDYEIATATTKEEIMELGKAGFTKYDENNGVHFYRKLKKFRSHS
jgi:integrase